MIILLNLEILRDKVFIIHNEQWRYDNECRTFSLSCYVKKGIISHKVRVFCQLGQEIVSE